MADDKKQKTAKPEPKPGALDPKKTRMVKEYKHGRPMLSCRFDLAGAFVLGGAQDYFVHRWQLATDKKSQFEGHGSWVRAMAFHPAGKTLVTGDYAGRVSVWPYAEEAPKPSRSFEAHDGWVRSVSISKDGKRLATGGNDNTVRVWSIEDGSLIREFVGHKYHVYYSEFHPDGNQLVSTDLRGVIKHWDVATGGLVRELDATVLSKYDNTFGAHVGGIRRMVFTRDGSLLACSGITNVSNAFAGIGNPMTLLFDWKTGKLQQKLVPKDKFTGFGWGVVIHPDGFLVGIGGGGSGGALWFWNPDDPKPFHTLKLKSQGYDLDLHPDGRRLAVAHYDKTLRIYEMAAAPKKS